MPRGGKRTPGQGKKLGRPSRPIPTKVRRDVAHEVLDILNTTEEKRIKIVAKANPEARFIYTTYLTNDQGDKRLKWDVYRYMKECVDHKPMVRSEEKVIFDPDAPLRVVVEHIGQPAGRRS
jgi:hypothetical protein